MGGWPGRQHHRQLIVLFILAGLTARKGTNMNENKTYMRFLDRLGMTGSCHVERSRNISLALAVLLLSAGCLRIETNGVSDHPMTFGTYTPRTTKAAAEPGVVSAGSLPSNTSFGVFAFYQPGTVGSVTGRWGNGGSRSSWKPDYMFNEQVDFDGTSYTYSPLRYWPSNEENTISFWAYWPIEFYNASNNSGTLKFYDAASYQSNPASPTAYNSNSTGLPVAKYTVSANPAQQYDLLFDSFANTDKTYENCSPTQGTVPLTFRHVLSQVQFSITPDGGTLPDDAVVTLNSFQLTGIYSEGVCVSPGASIAANDANAHPENYWTSQATPVNISLTTGSETTVLLLMPQALAEQGSTGHSAMRLEMSYDISFPAAHDPRETITYSDNTVDAYIWSDVAATPYGVKRWLPGRKYVYNIEAGLERIEFSEVTEESWTTEVNGG